MDIETVLKKLGCNSIEATKARFLNDRGFFLEIVDEMLEDPGFERLGEQLEAHQVKPAFETAHMLKGVIANCGVTPMLDSVVKIVEPLRSGEPDFAELQDIYKKLMAERAATADVIRTAH